MSGRWVEAAEAVRLGLATRVETDPDQAADALARVLAGRAGAPFGGAKAVAASGGLRERLRAERAVNRAEWERPAPAGTE
jgi:enoyl-CoA hydratase/carnithine racemase